MSSWVSDVSAQIQFFRTQQYIYIFTILYCQSFSEGSCSFHLIMPAFYHYHLKIIPALWLCDTVTSPILSNSSSSSRWYVSALTSTFHITWPLALKVYSGAEPAPSKVITRFGASLTICTKHLPQRCLSPSGRICLTPKQKGWSSVWSIQGNCWIPKALGGLCPALQSSKLGSTPGKIRWSSSVGWQSAHSKLAVVSQLWTFFSKTSKGTSPHPLICKFSFCLTVRFTSLQSQHWRKHEQSRGLEYCHDALLWKTAFRTKTTL